MSQLSFTATAQMTGTIIMCSGFVGTTNMEGRVTLQVVSGKPEVNMLVKTLKEGISTLVRACLISGLEYYS